MPEFREIRPISWSFSQAPRQGDVLQAEKLGVPTGFKVLLPQKGKAKARPTQDDGEQLDREKSIQVGLLHTPEEFTDEAFKVIRLLDSGSTVSDDAKRNMFWILTHEQEARPYHREVFDRYDRVASEMADIEAVLHSHLDPQKRMILKDKRLLLFERLCSDAGVEDDGLTELMVAGVKMTGRRATTGQFPQDKKALHFDG